MSIAILTPGERYFAASHLAKALDAKLYSLTKKEIAEDNLIIIGMRGLERYNKLKQKIFKSIAVIFSDTNFCIHHKWCNDFLRENNYITVYAMPDLHDYLSVPYIPAYQTIEIPADIEISKPTDRIIISHSPGNKAQHNYKGTKQITKIVKTLSEKHNIEFKILSDLSWKDCLIEKAKSHIFIDQLIKGNKYVGQGRFGGEIPYKGGLGKSGIEAMSLGCCTITTMDEPKTEPYFPPPPMILTTLNTFVNDLEKAIIDTEYRLAIITKQLEWVKKYCSPEFVKMNITRHI